jgi:hypothetical protein
MFEPYISLIRLPFFNWFYLTIFVERCDSFPLQILIGRRVELLPTAAQITYKQKVKFKSSTPLGLGLVF